MKYLFIGLTAALFLPIIGIVLLVFTGGQYQMQESACQPSSVLYEPVSTTSGKAENFDDPDQVENIQTIIGIGLARKLSLRDIKIALMVAMQESHIRNLAWGDRDSLGIFQQRPSVKAWGTAEQIMDPIHATNKFYEALERVKNRDSMSLFEVAVKVQVPSRSHYARTFHLWDTPATAMLADVSQDSMQPFDVVALDPGCAQILGDAEIAVQAALSHNGKAYQWASSTSSTKPFDSGGLMQWAYAQAGITLPPSAAGQQKAGPAVPKPGSGSAEEWKEVLQRGDLLYWTNFTGATSHVSMYLGNDEMIDAPSSGVVVAVSKVPWNVPLRELSGVTRPINNTEAGGQHSGWQWPLKSVNVTSSYGMRYHPILHVWKLHDGVDFRASTGTPVYAANSGAVTYVGRTKGGGNTITISHAGGIETSYLHLSSTAGTRVGQQVRSGQQIGQAGSTGYSTGPHLHLIVRVNGKTTDPIPYLKQFGLVP